MPSQVEQQSHDDPRAPLATAESGSEDEAIALFNQRAQSQATDDQSDEPTDDPGEVDPQEATVADPEELTDAEDNLVEVEFEGKTYSVPPEIQKSLLRQADYSRQSQVVAAAKKDYAQRIESADKLIEGAEKFAEVIAEGKALDAQIKSFDGMDWTALERDDPARASLLAVKLLQLQQARASIDGKAQAIERDLADGRSKDQAAKQAEMLKVLAKEFPGWGEEAGTRVTTYAIKAGFTPDEIRNFTDPKLVLALEKARKFDAIQDGKNKALAQTREAQPVARPGAPRRTTAVADAQTRFQKSTSPEDAVALFEARAGQRKR